jgi:type I restriction enzyme, R subunit
MNEAETRAELIDPALKAAGWGVVEASRVRREVITLGHLQGASVRAAQDIADQVLICRNHKSGNQTTEAAGVTGRRMGPGPRARLASRLQACRPPRPYRRATPEEGSRHRSGRRDPQTSRPVGGS